MITTEMIECYIGRNLKDGECCITIEPDFPNGRISIWNVAEFPLPTNEQLEQSWNENHLLIERNNKLNKLRIVRDSILKELDWIDTVWLNETSAISFNLLTEQQRSISQVNYILHLQYKKQLRDLPDTILSTIDTINIEDIWYWNETIFGTSPIQNRLTTTSGN